MEVLQGFDRLLSAVKKDSGKAGPKWTPPKDMCCRKFIALFVSMSLQGVLEGKAYRGLDLIFIFLSALLMAQLGLLRKHHWQKSILRTQISYADKQIIKEERESRGARLSNLDEIIGQLKSKWNQSNTSLALRDWIVHFDALTTWSCMERFFEVWKSGNTGFILVLQI